MGISVVTGSVLESNVFTFFVILFIGGTELGCSLPSPPEVSRGGHPKVGPHQRMGGPLAKVLSVMLRTHLCSL